MPQGLMDAVKPFIDYHEEVQGLDFCRTIFIFLSNTGRDEINKIAYNSWESGKHREDLTYKVRKFNMFTQIFMIDNKNNKWF